MRVSLVRASGETHVVDLLELRDGARAVSEGAGPENAEPAALPPLPAAYDAARAAIAARRLVLPPSGAVATATDESRGLWKAPAGVALEGVEAPSWAVFEPNEERTWNAVRKLAETYLVAKWRGGALAGSTPREAFYVRCGLGSTMTDEDVAAGRLILEVGVAAVRPAEFILLRIAHAIEP